MAGMQARGLTKAFKASKWLNMAYFRKRMAGSISFEELDHEASGALEKFRVLSLQHHQSMRHMWQVRGILESKRDSARR